MIVLLPGSKKATDIRRKRIARDFFVSNRFILSLLAMSAIQRCALKIYYKQNFNATLLPTRTSKNNRLYFQIFSKSAFRKREPGFPML